MGASVYERRLLSWAPMKGPGRRVAHPCRAWLDTERYDEVCPGPQPAAPAFGDGVQMNTGDLPAIVNPDMLWDVDAVARFVSGAVARGT